MLPRPVEAYASDGYINFTDSSEQADVKSSVANEAMNSTGSKSDESDKQPPEKERLKRNFQMTISENEFTEEKFELWRRYQHAVHGDAWNSLTKRSFTNFLVDTPMCSQHARSETGTVGLGSFHQHYRVDGKLIAVGVLDFLPNYLSSKYFFFDPDYRKLALGTYSAIQEARLAFCEGIKYYCMGYFVANSKMRYKAQFSPSEILCPRSLTWIDFQECADQLEACSPALRLHLPSQFEELALKLDEAMKALWLLVPSAGLIRLEELEHILVNGTEESVDKILQQLRESLSEFVRLVGQECIKRVAYLLPESITQMLVPRK
jgi:arginine-tRNA-protein transferase